MSIARAIEVAYVAFTVPDLGRARAFLLDFGMLDAGIAGGALHMKGHGQDAFLYRASEGAPAFAGLAFAVSAREELERLAEETGNAVEPMVGPGGGYRVRMTDPDGFLVEAVAERQGHARYAPSDAEHWNAAAAKTRVRAAKRLEPGPAHVGRLGHVVLAVTDFARSETWYKAHFGLLTSDEIENEEGSRMGAFLRLDLGDEPTDHHSLFLAEVRGPAAFRHAAFEVRGMDDLMAGHEYLKSRNREPAWGVGRHLLGSQVFDYWFDPWGHMLEHWTDGDLFTARDRPNIAPRKDLHTVQWGPDFPVDVFAGNREARG